MLHEERGQCLADKVQQGPPGKCSSPNKRFCTCASRKRSNLSPDRLQAICSCKVIGQTLLWVPGRRDPRSQMMSLSRALGAACKNKMTRRDWNGQMPMRKQIFRQTLRKPCLFGDVVKVALLIYIPSPSRRDASMASTTPSYSKCQLLAAETICENQS